MGVDNSVSMEKFCKNFKNNINRLTEDDMEFDMIGVDASIANAFRRILIAEVPTMATEKIFMADNTSVIADEVLAHRLGLIPLDGHPSFFIISHRMMSQVKGTLLFINCMFHVKRVLNKLQEDDLLKQFEVFNAVESASRIIANTRGLQRVLAQLSDKRSITDCEAMIQDQNVDGDSGLGFHEFQMMMTKPAYVLRAEG